MKRLGQGLATGLVWTGRIVGGIAAAIAAIVGVGFVGLLVVSLALHALGIWKTPPEHQAHRQQRPADEHSAYEPTGYPEGTGYSSGTGYESSGYPSGTGYPDETGYDPTPEKINGEDSYEFEPDDLERAEEADEELREYCEGTVSPAQELGCLSHAEIP